MWRRGALSLAGWRWFFGADFTPQVTIHSTFNLEGAALYLVQNGRFRALTAVPHDGTRFHLTNGLTDPLVRVSAVPGHEEFDTAHVVRSTVTNSMAAPKPSLPAHETENRTPQRSPERAAVS